MIRAFREVRSQFLRILRLMLDGPDGGVNFQEWQSKLKDELDGLGRLIVRVTIEAADQRLREEPQLRKGWVIVRRDRKVVMTRFGPVEASRTYFRHKATGRHRYLVDEQAGWRPHMRVDDGLKAELVEEAIEKSYSKSGAWSSHAAWHVSGQTVMKAVRGCALPAVEPDAREKRCVRYVYVEADEDHVGSQGNARKKWQPRLVYVHEGAQACGKQVKLRGVRYFGGLYDGQTESLWWDVWRYLDRTYDLERVERIYIWGDGAEWIRKGCEFIPGSTYVLDRYHASRYVQQIAAGDRQLHRKLWDALEQTARKQLQRALEQAYRQAPTESRKRAIRDAERYFKRNWDGVRAWKAPGVVGCSAESHVSHVYAARLSSRPRAWSRDGVDKMARLRVLNANGHEVKQAYLQQVQAKRRLLKVSDRWVQRARRYLDRVELLPMETFNNLPALRGRRSMLTRTLRSISNAS